MIPYYPENTKQLQQQGLLDLGMRLLQAGGPQHPGMGFGARLGQAGAGNLQAMRGAGHQMAQTQMLQEKQKQAKAIQDMRMGAARNYEAAAMARGPLSRKESAATDIGMANILGGKAVGDFSTGTLFPDPADAQKAQSPFGKLNQDFKAGLMTQAQFEKEVQHRYEVSGNEKVYQMKLRHLQEIGIPRDISIKVLTGMYKQYTDPVSGTVVVDLGTNKPIGHIKLGRGWVPVNNAPTPPPPPPKKDLRKSIRDYFTGQ